MGGLLIHENHDPLPNLYHRGLDGLGGRTDDYQKSRPQRPLSPLWFRMAVLLEN